MNNYPNNIQQKNNKEIHLNIFMFINFSRVIRENIFTLCYIYSCIILQVIDILLTDFILSHQEKSHWSVFLPFILFGKNQTPLQHKQSKK